jgi:beta-glucanase (GH16 family)
VESNKCGPACNPELCDKVLNNPNPTDLVWSDEFNVDGLPDPSKWGYDLGDGCPNLCNWGNGEQAYFTKLPSNVFIANGKLSISAKKESGYSLPYTSARIVSRGLNTFKYGRIQFRANLAKCKARGTWPALWMLPERSVYGGWPNSGEIDVMETVGHEPDRFFGTVHTKLYNGMIGTQKGGVIGKSKDEWHTFEINWEQDRIQFAVDKQIYFEYLKEGASNTWPFDQDLHLIMNIAVGGTWGGAQGIDEAAFLGSGQIMEVDWIRVFNNTR